MYEAELEAKSRRLRERFAAAGVALPANLELHRSQPTGFRQRAEFGVWHKDERSFFCMFEEKRPVEIASFPMGSKRLRDAMDGVLRCVLASETVLRRGLFQARFHTTLSGEALVTLIYRRKLDAAWSAEAEALRSSLGLQGVVGRSKGQKLVAGRDSVTERLPVNGAQLEYEQLEGTFSQSNAGVAAQMLSWASDAALGGAASARDDDLLELYCGSGSFTVALAPRFRRVLATEISKAATAVAVRNAERNGVANIAMGRVSAEELRQAMDGVRLFERLKHVRLDELRLNTVLVDPPRAGLGAEVACFLARFDRIVYISCNPETLVDDLGHLRTTHAVSRAAIFDQFPYTHHLECGVLLERR